MPTGGSDPVWERSIRFALTVATPIAVGWAVGPHQWFVYAFITSIAVFSNDTGGLPRARLGWMALSAGAIALGCFSGTLVAERPWPITLGFVLCGLVYALTESAHQVTLTTSRFLCLSFAISALYIPGQWGDAPAIAAALAFAWSISVLWDRMRGCWRKDTGPRRREMVLMLKIRRRERLIFAAAVALTVPAAYWTAIGLGLPRPYWALLALTLVLRVDFLSSRKLMTERFLGTLLGVVVAAGYIVAVKPNHVEMMIGIIVAALARWPAQRKHGVLGVGALTAFVMLMLEFVTAPQGDPSLEILGIRVIDTALGCSFAFVALAIDRGLRWLWTRAGGAPSR